MWSVRAMEYVSTANRNEVQAHANPWTNPEGMKGSHMRGTWVAQSAKCPILGFGSGHDLAVREFEPRAGLLTDSVEPAWDSLSLSLSLKIN